MRGVSLVLWSLGPLVGEAPLELLDGFDSEVQYLSVGSVGPLVG